MGNITELVCYQDMCQQVGNCDNPRSRQLHWSVFSVASGTLMSVLLGQEAGVFKAVQVMIEAPESKTNVWACFVILYGVIYRVSTALSAMPRLSFWWTR